jgi:hypothetical protein
LARAVGRDVVDGVSRLAARVEDDVGHEGAVEEGLDTEVEVGLRAGDRGAQVGIRFADVRRSTTAMGLVSRVTPVQTAMRNCTRDEGRSFEVGNQVLISNHRKLLWSKATVVNVAEKSEQDSGRYD